MALVQVLLNLLTQLLPLIQVHLELSGARDGLSLGLRLLLLLHFLLLLHLAQIVLILLLGLLQLSLRFGGLARFGASLGGSRWDLIVLLTGINRFSLLLL